ncbi:MULTISPECIES: plasmid partitioning protein RepA [unclassified Mesorhizobium]|uniref:plasmid partitioning protein RepA n=1 Tax=unclassified Mesorhizobium TaxID=325217 RepID=UPI000FE3FAB0|nr:MULTISPECIES: plasmid partitioning protein RepA [unclassified Mesorhizobium]RWH84009.1 MAG: plasmid partitioning protein RepA [Mesorhizobium sp.]RWK68277.1 MAG: plasmid partitioning protein RepA [Mesorhizobium sp.]RWX59907.1 plasmid partitioning protein RepA [Mesorhizobium sp. M4B.F.Ca.ET.089.01.1.1]TIQ19781.1 MAG: plasmid partitioning protein RepA [Mesorhizobium sp.]TIT06595.1 MAG: plasmid partitioning protein RepA [Mesorhizobium sp.]
MTRHLSSLHFMQTFSGKLEKALNNLSLAQYPPDAVRSMRKFASSEVAALLDVSEAYIRQVSLKDQGPQPEITQNGRRLYSLEQVLELRMHLAERGRKKWMNPRRIQGEDCQIIAVTNFKGGSSKTATTIHLGHYLALKGYRVLAVDLDPQASLTSLQGALPDFDYRESDTLYSAIQFEDPVPTESIVHKTHMVGFDVICAGLELTEFETSVALEMRKTGGTGFLLRVAQALEQIVDRYDVILLDCAPSLNFLTLSSLTASTGVLIPVPAHMLDVDSTGKFLELAASYMQILDQVGTSAQWDFAKFLITKFEPNDHPQANMQALMRQVFGEDLLLNMVIKSTAVADALTWKQSLYEVQRTRFSAPKTYDRAMESINAANAEIEALLWKAWGREQ